jgi:hypothetical protein
MTARLSEALDATMPALEMQNGLPAESGEQAP